MIVADLQKYLHNLAQVLEGAKAATVARELAHVALRLEPFAAHDLKKFADFLDKAAAYERDGVVPSGKSSARAKPAAKDPHAAQQAAARLRHLYDHATEANVTREMIEAEVQKAAGMTKAELEGIAKGLELTQRFKTKADVVKAIRDKILGRKGAFERVGA